MKYRDLYIGLTDDLLPEGFEVMQCNSLAIGKMNQEFSTSYYTSKSEEYKPFTQTREFYDLMEEFEKFIAKSSIYMGAKVIRVKRDENSPSNYFYEPGKANELFITYMDGYEYGKFVYRE